MHLILSDSRRNGQRAWSPRSQAPIRNMDSPADSSGVSDSNRLSASILSPVAITRCPSQPWDSAGS
jgi:hypothetical protein